ncbi:unnamed protein product [Effrenium voratum]|uniref:N-acetyltransferase domain-containing protein n=1 Tax=Effrenium voratum TaxID=2562239 RepID=A0AA36NDX7_9DINO|nr:unnamed protein product [Effrenium voratum]CAJ1456801.1 unnamed protein product [Effrenium voratum]
MSQDGGSTEDLRAYPSGTVNVSFQHDILSPSKSSDTSTPDRPTRLHVSLRNVCYDEATKQSEAKQLFHVIDKHRAHLREWLPWLDFVKKFEDQFFFLEKTSCEGKAKKSFVQVIEVREETAAPVIAGTCSFNFVDHERKIGYVGYWLSKEFAGLGLMTKCVEKLVQFGEKEFQLQHFDISCAVGNLKSQKVAGKLDGFLKLEGVKDVVKLYGVEHELMSFVRTVVEKPDYSAREARKDFQVRDLM